MNLLLPHPHCASLARAWKLQAGARRTTGEMLDLRFHVAGDVERIALPPARTPGFADELWLHTCFEAFIGVAGASGYHEINLAPSRQWAVYRFEGYRRPVATPKSDYETPRFTLSAEPELLRLSARVQLADLTSEYADAVLEIALAAVIEDTAGGLSYWALRHDGARPDFHDRRGFVVRLEARPQA